MRNAAAVLGLIAGLIGIIVGLVGYGSAELADRAPEITDNFYILDNPAFTRFASFVAPLLAIAGGAMARDRALWGGIAMALSCVAFYTAFGFNIGTMFPIGFSALGAVLAITARQPDQPHAH